MAREATITQEQVNAVADQIRGAGGKPTARAVREALGGGSMATVLKYLQAWQSGQVRTPEAAPVLPAGLQRALVDFIGQEVTTARASLEADLVALQQGNSDLIAENERQTTTLELQGEEIGTLQEERAELTGRLAQLTGDFEAEQAKSEEHRQAAEAARTEQAKLELRLEGVPRLEAEIDRLRTALEAERTARVAAEQAAAVSAATLHQVEARAEDLQVRLTRSETEARGALQEAGTLRNQVQTLQGSLEASGRELATARAGCTRAEETAAELRGQLTELRASIKPVMPATS